MSNTSWTPPTAELPDGWSQYLPEVTSLIRLGLGAAGAAGVTWANTVSASGVEMIGGWALIGVSALWSLWQKRRAKKALAVAAAAPPAAVAPKLPA